MTKSDINLFSFLLFVVFACIFILIGILVLGEKKESYNEVDKKISSAVVVELATSDNTTFEEDVATIEYLYPDYVSFRHVKGKYIILVPNKGR